MTRPRWRCFHCGEVFTGARSAAEHFGGEQGALTACQIKSHEGHILAALRKAEYELRRYRDGDNDLMLSIYSLETAKVAAVLRAEEEGYARGLRDGQAMAKEPAA